MELSDAPPRRPGELTTPGLRPPAATAKQVKCCGDTPVRHTGISGFNSPLLLEYSRRLHPLGCSHRSGRIERERRTRRLHLVVRDPRIRADGCSSQVPRGHDESDASFFLFSAGLAERLGTGLPPRPHGFDSHGPHVLSCDLASSVNSRLSSSAGSSSCFVNSRSSVRVRREAPTDSRAGERVFSPTRSARSTTRPHRLRSRHPAVSRA